MSCSGSKSSNSSPQKPSPIYVVFERYNFQTKHWYKVHGVFNSQTQAKASQIELYKNILEMKAVSTQLSDDEI